MGCSWASIKNGQGLPWSVGKAAELRQTQEEAAHDKNDGLAACAPLCQRPRIRDMWNVQLLNKLSTMRWAYLVECITLVLDGRAIEFLTILHPLNVTGNRDTTIQCPL